MTQSQMVAVQGFAALIGIMLIVVGVIALWGWAVGTMVAGGVLLFSVLVCVIGEATS